MSLRSNVVIIKYRIKFSATSLSNFSLRDKMFAIWNLISVDSRVSNAYPGISSKSNPNPNVLIRNSTSKVDFMDRNNL